MIIDRKNIFDVFRFNGIEEETTYKRVVWTSIEAEYEDARDMFEYLTGTSIRNFLKEEAGEYLETQMRQSKLVGFKLSCFDNKKIQPYLKMLFENGHTSLGYEVVLREKDCKKIKDEAEKELKARL